MIRLLALFFLATLGTTDQAAAQRAAQRPATASTRYIDAERLGQDAPKGVAEYAAKLKALAEEFAPVAADLKARSDQLATLERSYRALGSDKGKEREALTSAFEAGRRDLLSKVEQAEARYAKRRDEELQPVFERIRKAADRFAEVRRFMDLRFAYPDDLAAFRSAGARDVTTDFVSWYRANSP